MTQLFNSQWKTSTLRWTAMGDLTISGTEPMVATCVHQFKAWVEAQVKREFPDE